MENNSQSKLVCVTGGTGFVASCLITRLLECGYTVNTTVRTNPDSEKDISYLTNLPHASQRLRIFNADLDNPSSYITPIQGCIGVFHVAHPMEWDEKDNEAKVRNSLSAILQISLDSKTVKRFVYTSSASAVVFNRSRNRDVLMDEETWTDLEFMTSLGLYGSSYVVSKTLAERTVLEFAERNHGCFDVVTVVPSWIVGPFLGSRCPTSVRTSLALIFGEEESYKYVTSAGFVHVDDVARAHVFLFQNQNAKGRYICSATDVTIDQLYNIISAKYPEYKLPSPESWKNIKGVEISGLSTRKLLEAGFKYEYGLEDMLDGAIQSCKEKGFL